MPSARRLRLLVLTAVVAVGVIFYVTNGAEQTRSSPFYQKTVALMEQGKAAAREEMPPLQRLEKPSTVDDNGAEGDASEDALEDTTLRERLKDAELSAKKNADDKWRDMHGDPEPEWVAAAKKEAEAEAEAAAEGETTAAGTKEGMPYGISGNAAPAQDGVAHIGNVGHAQRPMADESTDPTSDTGLGGVSFGTPQDPEAEQELNALLKRAPVLIFSKTYCPHSAKAKRILTHAYTIAPPPHVVELDTHPMGERLQELLKAKTGRATVPNILINGVSVGGGDEVEQLWKDWRVEEVIKSYAGKKLQHITQNQAYGDDF